MKFSIVTACTTLALLSVCKAADVQEPQSDVADVAPAPVNIEEQLVDAVAASNVDVPETDSAIENPTPIVLPRNIDLSLENDEAKKVTTDSEEGKVAAKDDVENVAAGGAADLAKPTSRKIVSFIDLSADVAVNGDLAKLLALQKEQSENADKDETKASPMDKAEKEKEEESAVIDSNAAELAPQTTDDAVVDKAEKDEKEKITAADSNAVVDEAETERNESLAAAHEADVEKENKEKLAAESGEMEPVLQATNDVAVDEAKDVTNEAAAAQETEAGKKDTAVDEHERLLDMGCLECTEAEKEADLKNEEVKEE